MSKIFLYISRVTAEGSRLRNFPPQSFLNPIIHGLLPRSYYTRGGGRIGPQLEIAQNGPEGGRFGNSIGWFLQSNEKSTKSCF